MPDSIPSPAAASDAGHALRVAAATTVCLVLVEWWQLDHGNLAVWTTYMVMVQYTVTSFQKGVERIIGRGIGLLTGLVLSALWRDALILGLILEALLLLAFFYVGFAGRLAYTFLNAGLYLVVMVEVGRARPEAAAPEARAMFLAVILGVVVADIVTWLSGAERDLRIQPGGEALWPLRADWLNHALMLAVTALLTAEITRWLELPTTKAVISVMVLTITPSIQELLRKGQLRVVGALLASAWTLGTFFVLARLPHFPLLLGLLFLGTFLAAYLARASKTWSYAGVQMGLVLPLLLVVPPHDFGSIGAALQRLEGIVAALVASLVVGGLWPQFPLLRGGTARQGSGAGSA